MSEGNVVGGRSVEYKEKPPPPGPYHSLFLLYMPRYDSDLWAFLSHCRQRGYHKLLSWDNEIKVLFSKICDAMSRMHKYGIVNRDLKIENIGLVLLRDKVMTLISDHGHGSSEVAGEDLTRRRSGNKTGTPGYKVLL